MNINSTLIGQMITFSFFVWFTMKVIWPILNQSLIERKKRITEGLKLAKQGHVILKTAKMNAESKIMKAKIRSQELISDATKESLIIKDNAQKSATKKKNDIMLIAKNQINQSILQAKIELRAEVSYLIIYGIKEILNREINRDDHKKILLSLSKKL